MLGLEDSSGRGEAEELTMFIENLYRLHHVQHDVLRSNTNGLNQLSMVLTQSATGCRMDWLRRSATAHKTIRNRLCAVSVRSCQNGAQKIRSSLVAFFERQKNRTRPDF